MSVDANFSLGRVNTALTPQERFEEFMQTRGKRITRQRQVIVDHVTTRHEHFDAEQLLVDLKKTPAGAQASRPTIYQRLTKWWKLAFSKRWSWTDGPSTNMTTDIRSMTISIARVVRSSLSFQVKN